MSGQIVITPVAGAGYVARDEHGRTGEGPSPEAAVVKLREEAERRAKWDAMTITPPNPDADHPWMRFAGTLDPNHPMVQEWKRAVEEFRAERDRELLDDPETP